MASGLYFGSDRRIATILEEKFQELKKETGSVHSISFIESEKDFEQAVSAVDFDVIFIEQIRAGPEPIAWIDRWRRIHPQQKARMVLVSGEEDELKIFRLAEAGWSDQIHLPPDRPVLIEKFFLQAFGKRNRDVQQVYSLSVKTTVVVGRPFELAELSEVHAVIKSQQEISEGECFLISFPTNGNDELLDRPLVASCYQSFLDANTKIWRAECYFMGLTDHQLKAIRTYLKTSYIASKNR